MVYYVRVCVRLPSATPISSDDSLKAPDWLPPPPFFFLLWLIFFFLLFFFLNANWWVAVAGQTGLNDTALSAPAPTQYIPPFFFSFGRRRIVSYINPFIFFFILRDKCALIFRLNYTLPPLYYTSPDKQTFVWARVIFKAYIHIDAILFDFLLPYPSSSPQLYNKKLKNNLVACPKYFFFFLRR